MTNEEILKRATDKIYKASVSSYQGADGVMTHKPMRLSYEFLERVLRAALNDATAEDKKRIGELEAALRNVGEYADQCVTKTLKRPGQNYVHESHIHFVAIRNMSRAAATALKEDNERITFRQRM